MTPSTGERRPRPPPPLPPTQAGGGLPGMPCLQHTHRLATATTPHHLWQRPCKEDGSPLSTAPPRRHGGAPVPEARSNPVHTTQHCHRSDAEPSSPVKRREAPTSPSRHQLVLRPATAHHGHATGSARAGSHHRRREVPTVAAAGLSFRRQHLLRPPPPDPPERASIALPPDPAGAPLDLKSPPPPEKTAPASRPPGARVVAAA
jgi:hypothetical protein